MRAGKHSAKAQALEATDAAYRLVGLTIIALVPALFWTGVLAAVGTAIGHPLSSATLATVGAAIATFLFTAVSALFARIG
jgi:Ca2+/H+ antiporter